MHLKPSLVFASLFAALCLLAPAAHAASDCEAKALSKDGKPLYGASKAAFVKKCESESGAAPSCADKAIDKNGKALAGAAKTAFMKKCEAGGK
jgi:hypothetical protein